MRFLVAILLGALILGLGYTYSQENAAPIYLTAPVERGTVSTLVKANGTVEAVVSVDVSSQLSGRIAEVFVGFNDAVKADGCDGPRGLQETGGGAVSGDQGTTR